MEHDPDYSPESDGEHPPSVSEILEAMERDITSEPKLSPSQIRFLNSLNIRRSQGIVVTEDDIAIAKIEAQLLGLFFE